MNQCSVAPVAIYPTPMEVTRGHARVDLSRVNLAGDLAAYADRLAKKGAVADANGLPVRAELRPLTELAYGADEGYILTVGEDGIKIEAQTPRGVHYGMVTLLQLIGADATCPAVTVKDAPRNALRGVIEGFYGVPWTHEYRKELYAFMGENKLNAYIYAPKDDPKHREQWRTPYTDAELERMGDLIATAREHHVKFIYAISPGCDYMNEERTYEGEFGLLLDKCRQIYDLGVRDFAIFLDDIPPAKLDSGLHARMLNEFQSRFVRTHEGTSNLIAITPEYCDAFLTAYTDEISPLIHEDIVLMWTGVGVSPFYNCNETLGKIVEKYNRQVLIWWNYPVNDYATRNLFMDACGNLANDIYKTTMGLIANPMNQGYASMIPLFTVSDFLWNPDVYNRATSLEAACRTFMPDAPEALLGFIRMTCANVINHDTDSRELRGLLDAFGESNTAKTRADLGTYFESMIRNADAILASENRKMVAELGDWLAKYRAYGEMGVAYVAMEEAYAAGQRADAIRLLADPYKAVRQSITDNNRIVSGPVVPTMDVNGQPSGSGVLMPFFEGLDARIEAMQN